MQMNVTLAAAAGVLAQEMREHFSQKVFIKSNAQVNSRTNPPTHFFYSQ
jgi:hypothetical protein